MSYTYGYSNMTMVEALDSTPSPPKKVSHFKLPQIDGISYSNIKEYLILIS